MSLPVPHRWLPGASRALPMAGAAVAVTGSAVAGGPGAPLRLLGATVLLGALVGLLRWRAGRAMPERAVWQRLLLSGAVIATGAVAAAVCAVVPAWHRVGALPVSLTVVLAFPALYGGLLRWNRYSTSIADPNDVLNGFSAVLVAVALGNVGVDLVGGPLAAVPDWRLQPVLAATAACVIYLGTVWVLAVIAQLRSDPRIWLVTAGLTSLCAGVVCDLVGVGTAAPAALTALALLLITTAAVLPAPRMEPQPADPVDSTVGAFVLITVATLTLGLAAFAAPGWPAIACAGLATIGSSARLLVNVRDLADLAVSRREALTDELTVLPNRRAVLRRVDQLHAGGTPFVLGLIDMDKFKEVNDGLGHSAGDDLLRMIARRLEAGAAPGTLIGRLGGDEFALVAPLTDAAREAEVTARMGARLIEQFTQPFEVAGLVLHSTISVGLARHDADGHEADACSTVLLRRADSALYDAKRTGAAAVWWDPARHVDTSGRLAMVEELRTAISGGELVLHYQPQVEVGTGRTAGVEALVRWEHPTRGLLAPGEFLPLAEVHGLMHAVTEAVLARAVAQAAVWRRTGGPRRVSVNLSVSNLLDASLPARVAGLLQTHGLPTDALVLEVTETVLMTDSEASLAVLTALADLGITVSIDDFGTGYASLSYLRELPVSELKLDRSFTADLLTDARTEAIVSGTIDLAHRLGLRVVAEGVEQLATLRRLEALGCDESQGYLHSRPVPATQLDGAPTPAAASSLLPV